MDRAALRLSAPMTPFPEAFWCLCCHREASRKALQKSQVENLNPKGHLPGFLWIPEVGQTAAGLGQRALS